MQYSSDRENGYFVNVWNLLLFVGLEQQYSGCSRHNGTGKNTKIELVMWMGIICSLPVIKIFFSVFQKCSRFVDNVAKLSPK